MRSLTLSTVGAALLCSDALAQQDVSSRVKPITAPIRDVSVRVDRVTGAAKRMAIPIGVESTDPVFDNTCSSGYYLGLGSATATGGSQAEAVVDQGRVPNVSSSQTALCQRGGQDDSQRPHSLNPPLASIVCAVTQRPSGEASM